MKQYRTLLMIVTVLFIGWTFLIVESCAQVKLTQVESDTVLYRIPVAHRTIAGQPGKYFMKYMGLEPLMDSLDLKGTKIDSMTFASDTLKLYTNKGIFKVEILSGSTGTVTSVGLGIGTSGTDANVSGSPITGSGSFTLNLPSASASNRGLLTSADWTNFNNKLGSLNGLTNATQTFSITTNANDLTITSSGSNHAFNLPFTGNNSGIRLGLNSLRRDNSVSLGISCMQNSGASAANNIAIGNDVLKVAGSTGSGGTNNVGLGFQSLLSLTTGIDNMAIGTYSLANLTSGAQNVGIGTIAGLTLTNQSNNVFIGYEAGRFNTGSGSVFIGNQAGRSITASNKLNIDNTDTSTPLIGGDFSTNSAIINGDLTVTTRTGTATALLGNDANGKLINLGITGLTISGGNLVAVDQSITNEGYQGVTAGSGTSSVIQGYNSAGTATGTGTTINAAGSISISETTSVNGGQITLDGDYGAFSVAATTGGSGLVGPLDGDPFLTFTAGSGMTITRSGTTGDNQTLTFASTGGTTNLSYSAKSGTDVTLESSTGADVILRDGVGTFVNRVSANVIKYDVDDVYGQLNNTAIIGSATIDGVYRSVDFTAEDESFASIINAKTASDEIEVLVSGTYEIHYSLSYLVPSSRDVRWRIYKNTADIGYIGELTTYFTAGYPSKTFNIDLTAGDDISLRYIGVNGVSGTIDINSPILKVKRIK